MSDDLFLVGAHLTVEQATAQVVAQLQRAGVRVIVLKGPVKQRWLYPEGPVRPSVDVDVLVAPSSFVTAENALLDLGYVQDVETTAGVELAHAHTWRRPRSVAVDLHWSLPGADPERLWPVLASSTDWAGFAGERVEVPDAVASCFVVAVHAAQHGVGSPATMSDLERALAITEQALWEQAGRLARDAGALRVFVAGLSVVPEGRALLKTIDVEAQRLDEASAIRLATAPPTTVGFHWLVRQPGFSGKARYLAIKLVPPKDFMRHKYPVAQHGTIGLALAYLYRPIWLARWALPGYLSWRRARRASRGTGHS